MDSIWFRSPPPGYDANGDEIIYTSEVYNLPDHTEYRVTKDTYDYDYYAQRTFDFTMIWKEGDEDRHYYQLCDNDLTLVAKVKDYITNPNSTVTLDEIQVYVDNVVKIIDDNFVLESENGDSDILIDLSEENHDHTKRHNISFDPKTNHVTINCLDDISRTGEAIVYYLQQKNDDKLSAAGTDPIDTNDYWNIRMENTGVNSANTTQLFHDAVIDLLLSSKDDFNGHIHWNDEDRADVRAADANRGSLYLWRYTTNIDYSAQADSQPLATKDDQGNVVPAGDSPFCFSDCDKYDIDGYRYTYYVKESLRRPDYKYYQIIYTDSADQPAKYMPDGGTIINRLSDTIIFSVNAKWIAAARQGGTPVSATYMIQEYVNGEWVNTKVDGQDVTMTIDNFGAETMELYKEFGTEVPMYDEHGKRIEYRIVQTYVTRTDNGFTGYYDQMVYDQDNPTTITLHNNSTDGDQYEIRISTPDEADRTYTFDFVYRLTGKYDIFIQKIWDDTNNPAHTQEHPVTHADETITVNIEQRDCDTPTYRIYTPGVEVKITDTDYNNTPWTEKQSVDVYDDEGHEVYYRIKEPNPPENYFQVYSYDREKQLYTVKNIYAVGPTHLIETRKEWQDDGELEYRKPLDITASEDVYSPDNTPTGQTLQVNESNVWYCEFNRDFNYSFNSDHFSEKASGSNNTYYHNLENISTDSRVPSTVTENGKKWIYLFDQTTNPTGDNVIIENEISNNIIFFDNDDFAGIYKDEDGHYYAVEMKYTPADTTVDPLETSSRAYLTIINTRSVF